MRVAVRADASIQLGSGHVMRMLALADCLRAAGATVEFVSRPLPGHRCDRISQEGFAVHRLPGNVQPRSWKRDLEETRHALKENVDWLVVDHYQVPAEWEHAANAFSRSILAVDDLGRAHDCDVMLDQNYHAYSESRYAGRLGPRCEQLLGPRYALLREEFVQARNGIQPRDGEIRRVLVSFGAHDVGGETLKSLEALTSMAPRRFQIDVLVSGAHAYLDEIRARSREMEGCVLHVDSPRSSGLMRASDLAIGAAGLSMWERCAVGLPAVLVAIADNQIPSSTALAADGYSLYLGESATVTAADIASAVRALLANPSEVRRMSTRCLQLVDGRGTRRVSARLLADTVVLRRATPDDCERIYDWRNAEINRRQSTDPREIPLERHRAWFAARLRDASSDILIAERGSSPIGVLRYDIREGKEARISIYLVPGEHGKGLGRLLLIRGARWLRAARPLVKCITAEVLEGNADSIKAFTDAGFERRGALFVFESR